VARSFTLGGIGLHTGHYSFVRVRPALAGEGRYFVRVPPGTNAPDFRPEAPRLLHHSELQLGAGADDGVGDDDRGQLFLTYLADVDAEKFNGSFGDYIIEKKGDPNDTFFSDISGAGWDGPPEAAVPRGSTSAVAPAAVGAAETYRGVGSVLRGGGVAVIGAEALLAALEACGVDNARLEIESGADDEDLAGSEWDGDVPLLEVPVVDGSALGWTLEVQKSGVVEASAGGAAPGPRTAPAPQEMITVRDPTGDGFISFYPGLQPRITAGVDHAAESHLVGRQWFTWGPSDSTPDDNFERHWRWQVAPARVTYPSRAAVEQLLAAGLLRAGPDDCTLVALGEHWMDPGLVRFSGDEAARKAAADLMGTLSLAAEAGGRGLPQGHVVAYCAGAELRLKFAKALAVKAKEWAYAPVDC
jgi:UDP-3-O-[3-hydroxymyristoyl] N-acetylglucosamine deacetylase